MIGGERVIGVIPARGGSRAIPLKSIAPLGGISLLERAVALAKRVSAIDRIIISTDSEVIADVARRAGAEVYSRPAMLATDTALVIDALRDLIRRLAAEGERARFMVLLEAPAPFRQEADVEECRPRLVRSSGQTWSALSASARRIGGAASAASCRRRQARRAGRRRRSRSVKGIPCRGSRRMPRRSPRRTSSATRSPAHTVYRL